MSDVAATMRGLFRHRIGAGQVAQSRVARRAGQPGSRDARRGPATRSRHRAGRTRPRQSRAPASQPNPRAVWRRNERASSRAHFATSPPASAAARGRLAARVSGRRPRRQRGGQRTWYVLELEAKRCDSRPPTPARSSPASRRLRAGSCACGARRARQRDRRRDVRPPRQAEPIFNREAGLVAGEPIAAPQETPVRRPDRDDDRVTRRAARSRPARPRRRARDCVRATCCSPTGPCPSAPKD